MTDTAKQVCAFLDELGIAYTGMDHAPALTIADCLENDRLLGGVTAKNYFLATKNMKHFYLCLVRPDARFKSSDISKQAGSARLHFGPEDELFRLLRVHPGSVSPMGLMFDENHEVQLLLDRGLLDVEKIAFHPCDNTYTLVMATGDFINRFLPAVSHAPMLVDIHDFAQ